MQLRSIPALALACFLFQSCQKEPDPETGSGTAKVNFIFKFDSTQERLNAFGQPSTMPPGNAGQSPRFNLMSAHYVEMTPSAFTPLGGGSILYKAPQVTTGGATAIDFSNSNLQVITRSF